jgi:glucose-1-phosphate adenylyltransferase
MATRVLAMIMAGGRGTRLFPLTKLRTKPAVPFGGKYRIIDFVLSNFVNSGIRSIYVLTQFKAQALLQHLRDGWNFGTLLKENFVIPVPAQMNIGDHWYLGTADAIYQNMDLVARSRPDLVAVFGADHIYKMDIRQMMRFHHSVNAAGTVAALPVPVAEAASFGTIEVDDQWRITGFYEKTSNPPEIPGRPGWSLASMGNYLFNTDVLSNALRTDASEIGTRHDFGNDILPKLIQAQPVYAYNFHTNRVPGEIARNFGYWRDVGTIEAYYDANMDLRSVEPELNLYNPEWPIRTAAYNEGPIKCTFNDDGMRGSLIDSIACSGCILAGGEVVGSVLGRKVYVDGGAHVSESILMENSRIGAGARLHRVIVDRNGVVPAGEQIGFDPEKDSEKYHVTETGITVVTGHSTRIPIASVEVWPSD